MWWSAGKCNAQRQWWNRKSQVLDMTANAQLVLPVGAAPAHQAEMLASGEAQSEKASARARRKSPTGKTTSNVVCSAAVGLNEDLFPQILELHVPHGATVADVTYGKGIFWKKVPTDAYTLLATDIATGTDCRELPYTSGSLDCVVLDPPYMEGLFRKDKRNLAGGGTYSAFRDTYSNGEPTEDTPKYHAAVLDLYVKAGVEAARVLKPYGVFIVKCQDEVSANVQNLTHVELVNEYSTLGFYAKDLFVLVRSNRPAVSRMLRQEHARKNHSYFLVFLKTEGRSPRRRMALRES